MRPIDKHELAQWDEEGRAQAEKFLESIIADHVIRTGLDGTNLAEALRQKSYVLLAASSWLLMLARNCEGG